MPNPSRHGARAWKGFDWDAMNRLHAHGYTSDPRGKAKSVDFTEEGFERAERLLVDLLGKTAEPRPTPQSGANSARRKRCSSSVTAEPRPAPHSGANSDLRDT
jgi:hypothetical protein